MVGIVYLSDILRKQYSIINFYIPAKKMVVRFVSTIKNMQVKTLQAGERLSFT